MQEIRPLIHGGDLTTCAERFGRKDFIDFSANIGPLGLPDGVRAALLDSAAQCERYPDALCRALRDALAAFEQVPAAWILCGNGAADLIYRIVQAAKPARALLLAPTFAEYEQALLQQQGCDIRFHLLHADDGFALRDDIVDAIPGTDIVFLCNPNNPTGRLIPRPLLEQIVRACAAAGSTLVIDECFLPFLEDEERYTLKPMLADFPNLIVLRAFTKTFAMPGLRLGYALCADSALLGRVERAGAPWTVSVPAQLCGIAATREADYLRRSRLLVAQQKDVLARGLAALGMRVFEPSVNYVLFYTPRIDLAEALCARGFVLRDCSNYRGLAPGWFRAAVRLPEQNAALLEALADELGANGGGDAWQRRS